MAFETISSVSVTHIPVAYRKELGRNSRVPNNIGLTRAEWLVRVKTDSGLEGLTIAGRFMREPDATVGGLLRLLNESFVGR